jgi:hypothetical protein
VVCILYWQGLFGFFVWDDRTYFLDNDILPFLSPLDLPRIFVAPSNYWGELLPLRDWLFVCEFRLFGTSPLGYHVVSLFLYGMIGYVVARLLEELYRSQSPRVPKYKDRSAINWSAFFVTALFLLHPSHVETVAYISGQKDLLSGLLGLLSLFLFCRYLREGTLGRPSCLLPVILCYYLAFLAKSSAVSFAVIIPVLAFSIYRGYLSRPLLFFAGFVAVNIPVYLWLSYTMEVSASFWAGTSRVTALAHVDRLLQAVKILGAHLQLALFPYSLSMGYPFELSWVIDSDLLFGGLVLLLFFWTLLRARGSLWFVGCLLFVAGLFPVLQLFGNLNNAAIYDRYIFISVLGIGIMLERAGYTVCRALPRRRHFIAGLGVLVLLGLAVLTFKYVPTFGSDVASTRHSYRAFPEWPSSSFNYAYSLIEAGEFDSAQQLLQVEKALSSPPWVRDYFYGWIELERGQLQQAVLSLQRAAWLCRVGGYYPFPNVPLGRALLALDRREEARIALAFVVSSQIHNPVESYYAKQLLMSIAD